MNKPVISDSAFRVLMCLVIWNGKDVVTYAVGGKTLAGEETFATISPEYQTRYRIPEVSKDIVNELLSKLFLAYVGSRAGCSIYEPTAKAVALCKPCTLTHKNGIIRDGEYIVEAEENPQEVAAREVSDPTYDVFNPR